MRAHELDGQVVFFDRESGTNVLVENARTDPREYGQLQLSVYDEDQPLQALEHLAEESARFGLNYLVTPARVRTLEADLLQFLERGARRQSTSKNHPAESMMAPVENFAGSASQPTCTPKPEGSRR